MKLELEHPEAATRSDGGDLRLGAVDVVVGAILPMPQNQYTWRQHFLERDLPTDGVVDVLETVDTETERGWPTRLVELNVRVADSVVSRRLICFYHLLEYSCVVVAAARDEEALDAQRAPLTEMLMSGWPNWRSDTVTSIHELWHGLEWPPWHVEASGDDEPAS